LRCVFNGHGLPLREYAIDIWMKGSRFHARDAAGRDVANILADLSAPRGLGRPLRTIEEMMDVSRVREPRADRLTDIYADRATDLGWIYRWQQPPWALPMRELVPVAEQILAPVIDSGLRHTRDVTFLNRPCTEYQGVRVVTADGLTHQSEVTLVVSAPFLLLNHTRDASDRSWYLRREVTQLDEGVVTDEDVTAPAQQRS
jgi:hypothetical protein